MWDQKDRKNYPTFYVSTLINETLVTGIVIRYYINNRKVTLIPLNKEHITTSNDEYENNLEN